MNKFNLFRLLPIAPALLCTSCFKTNTKTNVEEYLEILKEARDEADFHTELYIFPETIENREIKAFYYAHRTDLFTGSFLLYLVLEYNEDEYGVEKERISNVKAEFKDRGTKSVISYPEHNLYLTIKQNTRFEYAIYNDENRQIAYVSNQIFDWNETPVEIDFVIPELTIPSELDDGENMYNLYYWYEGDVGIYIND